jgi:hypothetical protein
MFGGEALIAVVCVVLGLLALKMIGSDRAASVAGR